MILRLNGKQREIAPGSSIADVLAILEFEDLRGVAVAVNGEVVPRSMWDGYHLSDGMKVEVLKPVQGG